MSPFRDKLNQFRIEHELDHAEAIAVERLDYYSIRELEANNPTFGPALANRALRQDCSNVTLALLYCLAMADKRPDISKQLLDRILVAVNDNIWKRLDTDEITILATLSAGLHHSRYGQLLGCFDQAQLKSVEPETSDPTYGTWLDAWLPGELSTLEKRCDLLAVVALLKEYPQATSRVVERAEFLLSKQPWPSLIYALALARHDSPLALGLLRSLIDLPPGEVTWEYMDTAELKTLTEFVFRRAPDLFERLSSKLDDKQFAATRPKENDSAYVAWLRLALGRGFLWTEVSENLRKLSLSWPEPKDILDTIRTTTLSELTEGIQESLINALGSGNADSPRIEGLLRQLAQILFHYGLAPDRADLGPISCSLGRMTIQACIPAGTILQYDPSTNWVPGLREAWYRIEEASRVHRDKTNAMIAPDLVLAAFAVAPALGVCAAKDPTLIDFANDQALLAPVQQLQERLVL